jgi:hypothetical protein
LDRRRICGPSLMETSLGGAYLYCASQSPVSQNVFDVRAQMLMKVNDTHFFILLFMYGSSQYISSRALTDCTDCVTVWMALTLGGERCEVRQFWDIISIIERSFCRIFDSRCIKVRIKILQETEILTICEFSLKLFTLIRKIRQTTNCI